MRLAAYLRVSSAAQMDAWGMDRQEAAIRQYIAAGEHEVVAWFRDEGLSGTLEAIDRPGLTAAIEAVKDGADGIVVADLDRFARALTVQEAALAVIWKEGGRVFLASQASEVHANDPDDPARGFIRQVMGAVAEFEKNQAVKRMRDGKRAKAAAGGKAVGAYAFGWRGEGSGRQRDAAPDPAEQETVRRILALRDDGHSYREIAALLSADNASTRFGRDRWAPMTIKRIYDREARGNR